MKFGLLSFPFHRVLLFRSTLVVFATWVVCEARRLAPTKGFMKSVPFDAWQYGQISMLQLPSSFCACHSTPAYGRVFPYHKCKYRTHPRSWYRWMPPRFQPQSVRRASGQTQTNWCMTVTCGHLVCSWYQGCHQQSPKVTIFAGARYLGRRLSRPLGQWYSVWPRHTPGLLGMLGVTEVSHGTKTFSAHADG